MVTVREIVLLVDDERMSVTRRRSLIGEWPSLHRSFVSLRANAHPFHVRLSGSESAHGWCCASQVSTAESDGRVDGGCVLNAVRATYGLRDDGGRSFFEVD